MGRIPLHSPKVIGVATSRGDRGQVLLPGRHSVAEISPSHQEDYHAIAALSLDPEGLRLSIKKTIGIDWEPENATDPIARQVVFVGLYDGYVNLANSGHILHSTDNL